MSDLLDIFKTRAEDLLVIINRKGGVRATLEGLRRQMAEADRRRAMNKVRDDLKRLNAQITEMVTAVGIQAVGLHQDGRLNSPELQPLCQHIVELKAAVAQQEAELAKMEAEAAAEASAGAAASAGERKCPSCGKVVGEDSTFCPYCGTALPKREEKQFCEQCGAGLRTGAQFCSRCGHKTK
ncbi:MAG: zinc ribbon domain-containing protein [Anaerolineae bacterium]